MTVSEDPSLECCGICNPDVMDEWADTTEKIARVGLGSVLKCT